MSVLKHSLCLLALFAILSLALGQLAQGGLHSSQGGSHVIQTRSKRQVEQDVPDVEETVRGNINWTTCKYTVAPKFTCQDCNTRIICLPIGGKVIPCGNVYKPHCNSGFCSAIPSAECIRA